MSSISRAPHKPVFSSYGSLSVRYGKAVGGGAPRGRNVLTVFDWAVEVIDRRQRTSGRGPDTSHQPGNWRLWAAVVP
jgi:hypothetical protein